MENSSVQVYTEDKHGATLRVSLTLGVFPSCWFLLKSTHFSILLYKHQNRLLCFFGY